MGDTNLARIEAPRESGSLMLFRKFAETMAENNSKALIEALEQVIRDFNAAFANAFEHRIGGPAD